MEIYLKYFAGSYILKQQTEIDFSFCNLSVTWLPIIIWHLHKRIKKMQSYNDNLFLLLKKFDESSPIPWFYFSTKFKKMIVIDYCWFAPTTCLGQLYRYPLSNLLIEFDSELFQNYWLALFDQLIAHKACCPSILRHDPVQHDWKHHKQFPGFFFEN